ncbi:hypothetical protein B0H19DRAFT_1086275 [Mycena capillaripes]|nr:hypothetical protein B0H19DRAFT_1086275 [Mycena capillaripes]
MGKHKGREMRAYFNHLETYAGVRSKRRGRTTLPRQSDGEERIVGHGRIGAETNRMYSLEKVEISKEQDLAVPKNTSAVFQPWKRWLPKRKPEDRFWSTRSPLHRMHEPHTSKVSKGARTRDGVADSGGAGSECVLPSAAGGAIRVEGEDEVSEGSAQIWYARGIGLYAVPVTGTAVVSTGEQRARTVTQRSVV